MFCFVASGTVISPRAHLFATKFTKAGIPEEESNADTVQKRAITPLVSIPLSGIVTVYIINASSVPILLP